MVGTLVNFEGVILISLIIECKVLSTQIPELFSLKKSVMLLRSTLKAPNYTLTFTG